jgi:ATP-binding cassette, subfamily B, multidrug efflux pump
VEALKYLNKYLLKYKWPLLLGTVFIILSNIFAIVLAPIVRIAVDTVADGIIVYKHFGAFNLKKEVLTIFTHFSILFGVLVLASALIKGLFMFFMRQTIIVVSRHIEFDLKNEIYFQYQQLGSAFYGQNFTGDLMNRISEDVSRVRMYLGPAIMYTINLVFMFIMVISVMVTINPTITLYVLLPFPFLSLSIYYVSDIINKRSDRIQSKLSDITSFVQEAFSGVRVIKSFAVEEQTINKFEHESDAYKNTSMNLVKVNALFFPLMLLLVGASVLITIWAGGREVIYGNFSYGNIAEYIIYVNMLTWPVASLGWVTSLVQRAAASQARINEFLSLQPEVQNHSEVLPVFESTLTFKNVSFKYPNKETYVLKNINFTLKKGEHLGIIGLTGSGKSTLAQLILRMYEVTEGEILLDGKNIKEFNIKAYRNLFGYVPQDVFLFSETIEENIAFGMIEEIEAGERRILVEQAAEDADVLEDVLDFEKQFETVLGERGITLSGGQKQRVAIARALIKKPTILVMDDSLSAVDTNTEVKIKENISKRTQNSTAIFISHRVSVIDAVEQIIVLDKGELVEKGSPEILMKSGGLFSSLKLKQQTKSNEIEE